MSLLREIAMTGTVLLLGGCLSSDPVYRTSRILVEPSGAQERILVGQCRQMHQQCEQFAARSRQTCDADAAQAINACVDACAAERTRNDVARGVHGSDGLNRGNCALVPCGTIGNECAAIGADCGGEFESCFVNAGGRIETERYCARNCES